MEKTHKESPWQETKKNCIISEDSLLKFFRPIIEKITEFLFLKKTEEVAKQVNKLNIDELPTYKFIY